MSTRPSKIDQNGKSRYDRKRAAFIAGVAQAINLEVKPLHTWQYKGSGALAEHRRGYEAGQALIRELLERFGY